MHCFFQLKKKLWRKFPTREEALNKFSAQWRCVKPVQPVKTSTPQIIDAREKVKEVLYCTSNKHLMRDQQTGFQCIILRVLPLVI